MMQIEFVDTNSLGHTDQISAVLQPAFASRPSGSDENVFIWPRRSTDFRSSSLRNPTPSEPANTLGDPFTPGLAIHSLEDALHQPYSTGASSDRFTNHTFSLTSRYIQPNIFGGSSLSQFHPRSALMALPNVDQAAGTAADPSSNADDFIELDLCSRSVPYMLDGDGSDHEMYSLRQLPLQFSRPDSGPLGRTDQAHHESESDAHGLLANRNSSSLCTTDRLSCVLFSSMIGPINALPQVLDDISSNCRQRILTGLRENTRRTRKGLRLLHRCGLEDLCASLYGLRNIETNLISVHQPTLEAPAVSRSSSAASTTVQAVFSYMDSSVIRSSSFTSAALVSPRRSTVPRDYFQSGELCTHLCDREISWPSPNQNNCLVNYILSCSHLGSSLLCPNFSSLSHLGSVQMEPHISTPWVTVSSHLSAADWRRGCASKLVDLLTSHSSCASKSSRTTVSRLVAGRFLMGVHAWRTVWPYPISMASRARISKIRGHSLCEELIEWISAWIQRGAVIVLAQLVVDTSDSRPTSDMNGITANELLWCHRVIYGVSQKSEIYLSNPTELVPVNNILLELSRQTTLRLSKSTLDELWAEHLSYVRPSSPVSSQLSVKKVSASTNDPSSSNNGISHLRASAREVTRTNRDSERRQVVGTGNMDGGGLNDRDEQLNERIRSDDDQSTIPIESHPHRFCVGDFSPLACQPDPRWNEMNVL
ncbi:unnamed protein product, partial [Echinostoma caproni]|uniref:RUN domain-containing protein n=1 Tax=Echinostoma caproni TaxID=27848 RepID=A0A183B2V6_9TREM